MDFSDGKSNYCGDYAQFFDDFVMYGDIDPTHKTPDDNIF